MDFEAYARTAVELVNSPLVDQPDVERLLGSGWVTQQSAERDLPVLRRAKRRLRHVFEHGDAGRDAEAVADLNALLVTYPVRPRISSHDTDDTDDSNNTNGTNGAKDWHMHVTGRGASAGAEYVAGAVWGLALWLCQFGGARFGVCADERCGNVYLDTSSNCCRRFCSERCATRSHVAAHRARKKATDPVDQVRQSAGLP